MLTSSSRRACASGSSLVDVMFAISLVAFASAALFVLYSNSLQMLGSQQTTQAATLLLQERLEQLHVTNWDILSSATSLSTLVRTTQPASAALLPGAVEEVAVSAYPAVTGRTIRIRRLNNGTVSTLASYTGLLAAPTVRLDVRVTWQGGGRTHVRENSLLLAQGGTVP